jgi:hypothetical protein
MEAAEEIVEPEDYPVAMEVTSDNQEAMQGELSPFPLSLLLPGPLSPISLSPPLISAAER